MFQRDLAIFATIDHDKHKKRRELWSRYLSKQSVSRLHPLLIQSLVNKLCDRLASYKTARKLVTMVYAFTTLTSDIVTEYSLPLGYTNLDNPEISGEDYDAWMALNKLIHLLKHFPWLFPLMSAVAWMTRFLNTKPNAVARHQIEFRQQAAALINKREDAEKSCKPTTARPSMIQAFLDADVPNSEKTLDRISAEAQNAYAAGTFTTTHVLNTATFHILDKPAILSRLLQEIQDRIPDVDSPPSMQQLESMDYLMAIWYEALRTFHGAHRMARVFPDTALPYKQWVIPPNTPVGMSPVIMHTNANIFPEPFLFKPERWLPLSTVGQKLLKYNVALGVGSRSCVGRELGKAEFLTTIAMIFRRFGPEMKLVKPVTAKGGGEIKCDFLNPLSGEGGTGLVVTFHRDGLAVEGGSDEMKEQPARL